MVKHKIPLIASSGYVAEVDEVLCDGCSGCQKACPFDAVEMWGTAVVKWEACMGCGLCLEQCANGARSLIRDETKGVPLDVCMLVQNQNARHPINL